jgi:hypothetical protein
MNEIVLIDLFYFEGNVHLISQDIHTKRVSNINFPLECPETNCTRFLVDVNYFIDKMDAKVTQSYCGKCIEDKKKPISEGKPKYNDDLLEFEF